MSEDSAKPSPFGNGWSEYRRLFLMYMEEEKDWRLRTEKRLSKIEQSLAVLGSQELMKKLETIAQNNNHFGTCINLVKKRLDELETFKEEYKVEEREAKSHDRKIWIAVITGGLALLGVILEKVL